jgi:hypothetical protein
MRTNHITIIHDPPVGLHGGPIRQGLSLERSADKAAYFLRELAGQPVEFHRAIASRLDEALLAQHTEMLRYARLRKPRRANQLRYVLLAPAQ